jgi:hypothetical protein
MKLKILIYQKAQKADGEYAQGIEFVLRHELTWRHEEDE